MAEPLNLYTLTRVIDPCLFNIQNKHLSNLDYTPSVESREIESLCVIVKEMMISDLSVNDLDGFLFAYKIPQIGTEFDLLKITDTTVLDIELKSENVGLERIEKQLKRNRYYLKTLQRNLNLFTIVTDNMDCYSLDGDTITKTSFNNICNIVKLLSGKRSLEADSLFRVSDYLVSPLNQADRFLKGEYFLTNQQSEIKSSIIKDIKGLESSDFYVITGKPGTGKTLLAYDIARELSDSGRVLIIHCGKLSEGQNQIDRSNESITIIGSRQISSFVERVSDYDFILIDECQRIYDNQFRDICLNIESTKSYCIIALDPEQILSKTEEHRAISDIISSMKSKKEYKLTDKIRTNKEMAAFITCVRNLKRVRDFKQYRFSNVNVLYANTVKEAKEILKHYQDKGYVFINYSKSNHEHSPYTEYIMQEDLDSHHSIGQEFDNVVMLMDEAFFYDSDGRLKAVEHPTPDYQYTKLFYQGITRTRDRLAIIIVENAELFLKMMSIFR